jgi:hypothetical protein
MGCAWLAAAVVAGNAGCGGDASPPSNEASPEQVASEFVEASLGGDATRVCELASDDLRSRAGHGCEDDGGGQGGVPPDLGIEVLESSTQGDEANVAVVASGSPGGNELGARRFDLTLVLRDDRWEVDAVSSPDDPAERQALAADAKAKFDADRGRIAIEKYAVDHGGSYAGATGLKLLAIDDDLASARLTVAVAGGKAYTLVSISNSGARFRVKRIGDGEVLFTCDAPGKGDCPSSGEWSPIEAG